MDRDLPPEIAFLVWLAGSLLLIMAFFVFMIMKFCWVPFPKALLIKVSGSMANGGGHSSVIVNGQVIYPGDVISVLYKNNSYRWRLDKDISKGFIWQPVPED